MRLIDQRTRAIKKLRLTVMKRFAPYFPHTISKSGFSMKYGRVDLAERGQGSKKVTIFPLEGSDNNLYGI